MDNLEYTPLNFSLKPTKKLGNEANEAGLELIANVKNKDLKRYRFVKCGHEQNIKPQKIRDRNFKCRQCVAERFDEEATKKDLVLIGPGLKNHNNRVYLLPCGHQEEKSLNQVRNGNIRCYTCISEKHRKKAAEYGYELIGEADDKNIKKRKLRCLDCHNEADLWIGRIGANLKKQCKFCIEEKYKKEAWDAGIEILGKGKSVSYRNCKFIECGHKHEIRTDSFTKNPKCLKCQIEKFEKEAIAVGLEYLGNVDKKPKKGSYRFLDCGHMQEISKAHVRDDNFICNLCVETYRTKPSEVYLVEIVIKDFKFLKLGYAKHTDFRIKRYEMNYKAKINVLKVLSFDTGEEANLFESGLHTKLKKKKISKEKMKLYMNSGFNECYPIEMKELLIEKLNEKENI